MQIYTFFYYTFANKKSYNNEKTDYYSFFLPVDNKYI